jgi:hypothetical protein
MVFPALRRACRERGRSSFSTVLGITVPGSKRSWASAQKRLAVIDYDRKDPDAVGQADPLIVGVPTDMRELAPGQRLSPIPVQGARAHLARRPSAGIPAEPEGCAPARQ